MNRILSNGAAVVLLLAALGLPLWPLSRADAQYSVNVTDFTGQAGMLMQQIQQQLACIQTKTQQVQQQTLLLQQMEQGTKKSASQLAGLSQLSAYESQLNQSPLAAQNLLGPGGPLGMLFNGSGLVGAGLGFIGNLMGLSGLPLGMSWMPPFLLTGLNAAQMAAAQALGNQFLGSGSPVLGGMLGNLGTMATSFAPLFLGASNPLSTMGAGALGNLASLAAVGASGGLSGAALPAALSAILPSVLNGATMIGNGAYVRPAAQPTDAAYQAVTWEGTGPQQAAFWTSQAGLPNASATAGGLYHPITGPNANAAYGLSPVASDIFTSGAWGAVQRYQIDQAQRAGAGGTGLANPLDTYAQQNLPAIQTALLTTPPGEPIVPRPASTFHPLPEERLPIVPVQLGAGGLAGAVGTLVTGMGAAVMQTFLGQMAANLQRIQQNYASEQINRQLYQHTQATIAALQDLQKAAQGLAATFTDNPNLPIAQVAQFRMLVNSEINARHQHLNALQQQIEHHRQTRYGLLQEHEHLRQAMRQRTILDGGGTANALLNQINARVNAGSNGA
ncbi:conserved membrane protein of unknown function [Methylacidimicrobium sp. AP8]|uniref:hypothetical protein n=1 Tax=Methylacidimicrobium sp. AP8 TaxID=2730359 RepID=UPI0018C00433|nr:hypothetical protein [Methylacidimicrobium sp. AP8]CAB4243581.1 conserved membrane protein of unknown function [Methylacidimicrobium sp. AP8]